MDRLSSFPLHDRLLDARGLLSDIWRPWVRDLWQAVNRTAGVLASVSRVGEETALPATPLTEAQRMSGGLYRVSVAARITQPATVSSSLTVTVRWTHGGVACALALPAATGNAPTTVLSDTVVLLADAGTNITYEAAYASSGVTPMAYALAVALEALP